MTREIPLYRHKDIVAYTLVDDADYEWLMQWRWRISRRCGYQYAATSKNIQMHRLIMDAQPGELIDHKNRNTLDNTRANLRRCNRAQNKMNSAPTKGAFSRFKGVTRQGKMKKWRARITVEKKQIILGYFQNEIDGARAYNEAAAFYFGEFAALNDI